MCAKSKSQPAAKKQRRRSIQRRTGKIDIPLSELSSLVPSNPKASPLERLSGFQNIHLAPEQRRLLAGRLAQQYGNQSFQQAMAAMQASQVSSSPAAGLVQRENEAEGGDTGQVTIRPVVYQYYNVHGDNLEEVSAQLDPEEWGRCHFQYTYSTTVVDGEVQSANLTLTLTIRLPRWRGRGRNQASQEARDEWDRMLEALRAHEEHHAEIARTWAPQIRERLVGLGEAEVETEFNTAVADAQAEQDQYDAETTHGQSEGVDLDLSIE